MTRPTRQYAALTLLLLWAAWYNTGNIGYLIHAIRYPSTIATAPFSIMNATRTIGSGPLRLDQILALNGRPFTAKRQYDAAVAYAHPGDTLTVVLSEPSGRAIEKTFVYTAEDAGSTANIALNLCLVVFVPVVCLVLGFGVAFIRPRDANAWLLLFVLVGFSGLVSQTQWYGDHPNLSLLWTAFCNSLWAVAMLLFAVHFPSRLELDRRLPWLKYIFLVPAIGTEVFLWSVLLLWVHNIDAALPFRGALMVLSPVNLVIQMLALSGFFAVLAIKSATSTAPDERRRLRILRFGSTVSFTPMFPIVLYSLIRGTDLFNGIPWPVQAIAFATMALFPVTLVYVIVVERAMDLSFVIRQSLQYAVARIGVRALRIGLIVVFVKLLENHARGWSASAVAQWLGIGFLGLVVFRQRAVTRVSTWVDRRFFREAYDTETVLTDLAVEAGSYVEIDPLLEKVAHRISDTLHVPDIVILVRDGNVYKTRYSTRLGQPMDIAAGSRLLTAPGEDKAPVQVYFDKPEPWLRSLDTEELQTLSFMRSELLLALRGRGSEQGQTIGIMSLGPKRSEIPYSKTDLKLLQAIAVQMGMALENSRLAQSLAHEAAHREVMNRELEIAREVQERLFPQKFPRISGVDCFGYCRPARGVGGDYYDCIELSTNSARPDRTPEPDSGAEAVVSAGRAVRALAEQRLGIAIGDVSGKGIPAALLMASLQASLRGQAMAGVQDLAELMANVNKLVYDASQSNRYATFFYGELNTANKQFAYVNGGHNAPVILRGDQAIRLEATGPVVGLLPGVGYTMETCQLQAGDIFVGYTDGISEAMNEQDEEWEEERFIAAAREFSHGSAKEMIEGIFRRADAFTGDAKQYDDMTLLVMKLTN